MQLAGARRHLAHGVSHTVHVAGRAGRRGLKIGIATAVVVLLLLVLVDILADRPIRARLESQVNDRLEGYSATVLGTDFKPWNLSLKIEGMTLVQDAHPDPPVARFPLADFNVQWSALFRGRVVGDAALERPAFHVNLIQLQSEWEDDTDIDDRGWQAALQAIYPLKINHLSIEGGSLTYVDEDPERPLELTNVSLVAEDIRNIRSPEREYPSPVAGTGTLFEDGSVRFDGRADFLAEPWMGLQGRVDLEEVPLDKLRPIVEDYRVEMRGGALTARGEIEYAPEHRNIHLEEVTIRGARVDYLHDPELTRRAVEAVNEAQQHDTTQFTADVVQLTDSELGFVNATTDPSYRLFIAGSDIRMTNLTNVGAGESSLAVRGQFMGSGPARLDGTFRPDPDGADFDLDLAIEATDLVALNEMLQAHGNFDVASGTFELYSELVVQDGRIDGYVKPIFGEVNVYTAAQDRKKNPFKRLWEGIVEGVGNLLENKRDEVATVADLSGSVSDPKSSNLKVVMGLIENAFFDAILPGFERDAGAGKKVARDKDRGEKNDATQR
jgi:hypothetical protein